MMGQLPTNNFGDLVIPTIAGNYIYLINFFVGGF
jgi:hypothetical protein